MSHGKSFHNTKNHFRRLKVLCRNVGTSDTENRDGEPDWRAKFSLVDAKAFASEEHLPCLRSQGDERLAWSVPPGDGWRMSEAEPHECRMTAAEPCSAVTRAGAGPDPCHPRTIAELEVVPWK